MFRYSSRGALPSDYALLREDLRAVTEVTHHGAGMALVEIVHSLALSELDLNSPN
jgi:hypothetical protein